MRAIFSRLGLVLFLVMLVLAVFFPRPSVHALTSGQGCGQTVACVSIAPITTCCASGNYPYQPNQTFTVSVDINLLSGQSLNAFEVVVNYTNPFYFDNNGGKHGVLQAMNINYSSNIFSSRGGNVLSSCVDGVGTSSLCLNETSGQVSLDENILGQPLQGPLSGRLFDIVFRVASLGTSVIFPTRTLLAYPAYDPSDPSFFTIKYITALSQAGAFGDKGLVAFFDYQPQDTSVSIVVLPNQPILFDAHNSFVANGSSTPAIFHWNFGDGTVTVNQTIPQTTHMFQVGVYQVNLRVWDSKNDTGQVSRVIVIPPALGNLSLSVDDRSGTPIPGYVQVQLYNSSSCSSTSFTSKTTNLLGQVAFNGLNPGSYCLTFAGPYLISAQKTETIQPALTTIDTVYLAGILSAPDYTGILYLGATLGGVAVVVGAIIYQRRESRRLAKRQNSGSLRSKPKRSSQ